MRLQTCMTQAHGAWMVLGRVGSLTISLCGITSLMWGVSAFFFPYTGSLLDCVASTCSLALLFVAPSRMVPHRVASCNKRGAILIARRFQIGTWGAFVGWPCEASTECSLHYAFPNFMRRHLFEASHNYPKEWYAAKDLFHFALL